MLLYAYTCILCLYSIHIYTRPYIHIYIYSAGNSDDNAFEFNNYYNWEYYTHCSMFGFSLNCRSINIGDRNYVIINIRAAKILN